MTLAQLRAVIRLTLANTDRWPDAGLDEWIRQAIRLYGAHFPLRSQVTIDLTPGVQQYELPVDGLVAVLSVEQPAGVAVPVKVVPPAYGDPAGYAQLVLTAPVTVPAQAVVTVAAAHPLPAADGDALTVPPQHIEALTAYVEFAAHYELECAEAPVLDGSTIVLSQLGDEARRAWTRYKEVMDRLAWAGQPDPYAEPYVTWGDLGL